MARLLVPEHEAVANPGPTLVSTTLDNGRVMPSGPTPALSSTHTTKTRYASSSKESIAADDVVISGVIEGSTKDGVATTSAAFIPPAIPRRRRGRQPRGEGDARRPSVRTDALAELGLSYAVTSLRRGAANPAVVADASPGHVTGLMVVSAGDAAAAEEKEAFAPGRTEAKALVRRLSRGLDVLDLYCGTGGFALNAAAGGARSARGVRGVRMEAIETEGRGIEREKIWGVEVLQGHVAAACCEISRNSSEMYQRHRDWPRFFFLACCRFCRCT